MLTQPQQWIATIPNGTNSYTLPINQPAGLQFMLTVWGNGGIEYAGTTTVLSELRIYRPIGVSFLGW